MGRGSQKEKESDQVSALVSLWFLMGQNFILEILEMYLGVECKRTLRGRCCIRKDQGG